MKPKSYHPAFTALIRLCVLLLLPAVAMAQPGNDGCNSAAGALVSGTTCTTTAGTLKNATPTPSIGAFCGNAGSADVWYYFTAKTTNPSIQLSSMGTSIRVSPRLQLLSPTCSPYTSISCVSAANSTTLTLNATGLTVGNVYYIRVFTNTTGTGGTASTWNFNICVQDPAPPSNDACASPITITSGTCNTTRTMLNANSSTAVGCNPAASPDVWFSYVATSRFPTFTLSNVGSDLTLAGPRIQIYSGTCGALTSLACVEGTVLNSLIHIGGATGLTVGSTYLVRVSTDSTKMFGSNWNFRICPSDPTTTAPTVDYGKSYINVTKQYTGGGTIEPGDVLEIRATFVVRSNNAYEVSFSDTRPANTTFVPGSLRILTSEGKIFRQWTDAADGDPATISGTAITINIGNGANGTTGGPLRNLDRPSLFGSTCVLIASYRVQVDPLLPFGTVIGVGGGSLQYKTQPTATATTINFPAVNAIVYRDYGICTNAVSNAILSESGGTFGSGTTKDRIASNKVPANYTYATFGANAPQDYYYGMSNNTSTGTTASTYSIDPNETASGKRVFGVWDVLGDHTGAVNPLLGNPPADVNNGQSGGYMAVINAAYRTDTAFLDTVRNLCPNTSYEYSAWFRNVCPKCGCDSTGTGASGAGYLPTAPGDSSGIRPTLTFNINGYDYYSTGDILYTGQWVKKGFTYRTGPTETEMVINIRNNSPGGGGNDWAIDDIAVSTCLPNMTYTPSLSPTVCLGNAITIFNTIGSYFDNYTHHLWQVSTDGGSNWSNLGTVRDSAAVFNPGTNSYEYTTAYTVPLGNAGLANNGDMYRVIVATQPGNLTNTSCQVTDGVSIVTLAVLDCGPVLKTDLLTFAAALEGRDARLVWSTSKEDDDFSFAIERSYDGQYFTTVATVINYNNGDAINRYTITDAGAISDKAWYRVVMISKDGKKKYSATIPLRKQAAEFEFGNVINPFSSQLKFDILIKQNASLSIELIDMNGKVVKKEKQSAYAGINSLQIHDTQALQTGTYTLRVAYNDRVLYKRVLKTN